MVWNVTNNLIKTMKGRFTTQTARLVEWLSNLDSVWHGLAMMSLCVRGAVTSPQIVSPLPKQAEKVKNIFKPSAVWGPLQWPKYTEMISLCARTDGKKCRRFHWHGTTWLLSRLKIRDAHRVSLWFSHWWMGENWGTDVTNIMCHLSWSKMIHSYRWEHPKLSFREVRLRCCPGSWPWFQPGQCLPARIKFRFTSVMEVGSFLWTSAIQASTSTRGLFHVLLG